MSLASPRILYGTAWKADTTADLVQAAIKLGYRAIDTACQPKHYQEPGVGAGVAAAGIPRAELYLQTKFTPLAGQDASKPLPYDAKAPLAEQVHQSCSASLVNLRTPYVDALLLHSFLPTHAEMMEVWRAFEALVDAGKVRFIGVSNATDLRALERLYAEARVKPSVVQNRFYAKTGYDVEIRAFCARHRIAYQSFWTLTANPELLASPMVARLAAARSASREQALFSLVLELGVTPLTGTTSTAHMAQDLAVLDWPPPTEAELAEFRELLSRQRR